MWLLVDFECLFLCLDLVLDLAVDLVLDLDVLRGLCVLVLECVFSSDREYDVESSLRLSLTLDSPLLRKPHTHHLRRCVASTDLEEDVEEDLRELLPDLCRGEDGLGGLCGLGDLGDEGGSQGPGLGTGAAVLLGFVLGLIFVFVFGLFFVFVFGLVFVFDFRDFPFLRWPVSKSGST